MWGDVCLSSQRRQTLGLLSTRAIVPKSEGASNLKGSEFTAGEYDRGGDSHSVLFGVSAEILRPALATVARPCSDDGLGADLFLAMRF